MYEELELYFKFGLFYRSGVEGNDMWVWHDTANGEDYVIMGTTHGSSFVRITDPLNPEVLGILRTQLVVTSNWRANKQTVVLIFFMCLVVLPRHHGAT